MLTIIGIALGGAAFSVCASLLYIARDRLNKPKTKYELWLEEAQRHDVIHKGHRRPESRILHMSRMT